MTRQCLGRVSRRIPRELDGLAIFQEAGVLGPVVIHQHLQSVPLCQVEEPARRHVIDAQAIRVELLHQREIMFHLFGLREGVAGFVGFEWAVGHPARVKLL